MNYFDQIKYVIAERKRQNAIAERKKLGKSYVEAMKQDVTDIIKLATSNKQQTH